MDWAQGRFTETGCQAVDHGPDFYAAQTVLDDKGRRIVIGWMNGWGVRHKATEAAGWAGIMTLPRMILNAEDGGLTFEPLPELAGLRERGFSLPATELSGVQELSWPGLTGDCCELVAQFEASTKAKPFGLVLRRSADGRQAVTVSHDPKRGVLSVTAPRDGKAKTWEAPAPLPTSGKLSLRAFVDHSSVEVFCSASHAPLSLRVFPKPDSTGVQVFGQGVQLTGFQAYNLKPITG